jgi:hypothetical protein
MRISEAEQKRILRATKEIERSLSQLSISIRANFEGLDKAICMAKKNMLILLYPLLSDERYREVVRAGINSLEEGKI